MGSSEAMRLLLDHGASIDLANNDGVTPLRQTLISKPYSVAATELLFARGVNSEAKLKHGKTVRGFVHLVPHGADEAIGVRTTACKGGLRSIKRVTIHWGVATDIRALRQEPMAAVSWHAAWRAWFEESMAHEHGLRPVHAKYPERITEKVTQTKLPGITAENAFSYAIDIGCVEPEHPYVRDFLAWTIQMSEAMLGDTPRWETQWTVLMHAKRRLVRAVLALAHGMRDNAEPDAALLKATRDDAMTAFDEATGENWDEGAQSDYLGSIQLCLMEGEVTIAAQMLRCNRRFAPTQEWYDWLAGLVANIEASGNGHLTDAAAIQAFDGLFDLVRDPKYKSRRGKGQYMAISRSFLRLQLAILRHKYIEGGPVAGYWRQILQSIAA